MGCSGLFIYVVYSHRPRAGRLSLPTNSAMRRTAAIAVGPSRLPNGRRRRISCSATCCACTIAASRRRRPGRSLVHSAGRPSGLSRLEKRSGGLPASRRGPPSTERDVPTTLPQCYSLAADASDGGARGRRDAGVLVYSTLGSGGRLVACFRLAGAHLYTSHKHRKSGFVFRVWRICWRSRICALMSTSSSAGKMYRIEKSTNSEISFPDFCSICTLCSTLYSHTHHRHQSVHSHWNSYQNVSVCQLF